MKSLLSVLALAATLGLAAGCGPQEAFCPNTGVDGGPVCPINGDDAAIPTMDMGGTSLCQNGYQAVIDPTADAGYRCVPKT